MKGSCLTHRLRVRMPSKTFEAKRQKSVLAFVAIVRGEDSFS